VVEARQLSNPSFKSKIVNYIFSRQNQDGGYCFAQGALESNSQDTYYGLAILNRLGAGFPNAEKTQRFLYENRTSSVSSMYFTAKAQLLLGKEIDEELENSIKQTLGSKPYFGSDDFFCETSELSTTLMALELAELLKIKVSSSEIAEWILAFEDEDGGYGPNGNVNIDSTYHAIASLSLLGRSLKEPEETLRFVRSCEKPSGGFTVIPMNATPYMEYTYFGVRALDLLGEKSRYPAQTIDWVLRCQNRNGGFSRSDLGISTFADTYRAVEILKKLEHT
jgi:hypothetical protein